MFLPKSFRPATVNPRSLITSPTPLDQSRFSLDVSGVAGFLGGEEATSALSAVHIYRYQRWLGWYNTPGSYQIARKLGSMTDAVIFKMLFPGAVPYSSRTIDFDGREGPRFIAVHSGTIMPTTGHLADVLVRHSASLDGIRIQGRPGSGVGVTVVRLSGYPPRQMDLQPLASTISFLAVIPIITSISACIANYLYCDWFSFTLILWGMLSSGVSYLVIGSGVLSFEHSMTATGAPLGDGILDSGREFVLLLGEKGAIDSITLGKLSIEFPAQTPALIGYCSILLTVQFIAQLLLIPQASLFGQIMFLATLAMSWGYNSWLSTFDKVDIQRHILLNQILRKPAVTKYYLGTRVSAVVFALCFLSPEDPNRILEQHLPNNTMGWRRWKETIAHRLRRKEVLRFTKADWNLAGLDDSEKRFLRALYGDTQAAYEGFLGQG